MIIYGCVPRFLRVLEGVSDPHQRLAHRVMSARNHQIADFLSPLVCFSVHLFY